MNIVFAENAENGLGTLIITAANGGEIEIPHASYSPLGRIWSDVRKRIREITAENDEISVDVVGLFTYPQDGKSISCSFCPNHAIVETSEEIDGASYTKRFNETFGRQMAYFESVLRQFLESPSGLATYSKLHNEGASEEELEAYFKDFLTSIGVRTDLDNQRAEARARRAEKRNNKKPAN